MNSAKQPPHPRPTPPCPAKAETPCLATFALGLVVALAMFLPAAASRGAEIAPSPPAQGPSPIDSPLLNALIEQARTNHPGLRSASQRERAARRHVDTVRLWDDPMLRVGGVVAGTPGPDLPMEGDLVYEVQQPLPLFGKATAMRREAEAGASVAEAAAEGAFQLVRRDVVQAVYRLALADTTLAIGNEDLETLRRMAEFARERQKAGIDSPLDLLRIENERARREQQQITDQLRRDFERATLNRLVGRPQDSEWSAFALPDLAPEVPITEALYSMAVKYEPRLKTMRREIAMADASVEATRRRRYPDVTAGIETRQWSGTGGFREGMFSVGLNLPWFNRGRYRAELDRDRTRADALRSDTEDYELDVRREVFRVWTRIDATRREGLLYRDQIQPRARLALDTALAAWTGGRAMYLDVMEARRMWIEARLMLARAVTEQHEMIAELVTCCGVAELDSLTMLGVKPPAPPPAETSR